MRGRRPAHSRKPGPGAGGCAALREITLAFLLLLPLAGRAAPAEEDALWALWRTHTDSLAKPAAVISACRAFEAANTQSPFVIVSRGLQAWQLQKNGPTNEAAVIWQGLLSASDDPMHRAGAQMARTWLTRADRDQVRLALRQLYNQKILYPVALPESIQPATDRWGKKWAYRLTQPRFLKDVTAQIYELQSPTLGANSDLQAALAIPYGSRLGLHPVRVDGEAVTFTTGGGQDRVVLSPGTEFSGTAFVFLGESLLVLSDGNHWAVLRRPGGGK